MVTQEFHCPECGHDKFNLGWDDGHDVPFNSGPPLPDLMLKCAAACGFQTDIASVESWLRGGRGEVPSRVDI